MLKFYRHAALVFFCLASFTLLFAWFCIDQTFVQTALSPRNSSSLPWKFETVTDAIRGGTSNVSVMDDAYNLDYHYHLTEAIEFPYVVAVINFENPENTAGAIDLTKYSTVSYRIKCSHDNIMSFYLLVFDEQVTRVSDFYSYRIAEKLFSCNEEWEKIEIDLQHLSVPVWWLETHGMEVTNQHYRLDKVLAMGFDASRKGPLNTSVDVKISDLILHGRNRYFMWVFVGVSILAWSLFLVWLLRQYTASLILDVKARIKMSRPLIAYQQLSIEPHQDKEKSKVLRFMATEYANAEMSLEFAQATLGIEKTRINEFLKDELGLTFSLYLNKLRLSEAARLLATVEEADVAEIAYSVGYNNVSYFNKLFKQEYDCTPGKFRVLYESGKPE